MPEDRMSRAEAGRRGGLSTKKKYGSGFYQEIGRKGGKKGGQTTKDRYGVDVMKVEVPINMKFVEGAKAYGGQKAYSKQEAMDHFRRAADVATDRSKPLSPFKRLEAVAGTGRVAEVRALIHTVSEDADHYDDELVKEFGGRRGDCARSHQTPSFLPPPATIRVSASPTGSRHRCFANITHGWRGRVAAGVVLPTPSLQQRSSAAGETGLWRGRCGA